MKATHRVQIELAAPNPINAHDLAEDIAVAIDACLKRFSAKQVASKYSSKEFPLSFYAVQTMSARASNVLIIPLEDGDNID